MNHPQRVLAGRGGETEHFGIGGRAGLLRVVLARKQELLDSDVSADVGRTFDLDGFAKAREPIELGPVDLDLVPDGIRVSSLPVKFPGSDYRLPLELESLGRIVSFAAAAEALINPEVDLYYSYLTVHCSEVAAGEAQRGGAIHSDGLQGPRINPKQPIERGYLAVDRCPPLFFAQGFDMSGLSVDRHRIDLAFEAQARRDTELEVAAGSLVLFDSYNVHQAQPATEPGRRVFVRVAYSTRQYDRLGNSVNDLFAAEYEDYDWHFEPRPLPAELKDPPGLEELG